jgi:hypothetical protein
MKLYDIIVKEKQQTPHTVIEEKSIPKNDQVFIADVIPTHSRRKKIIFFLLTITLLVLLYMVGFWVSYAKITLYERAIPFTLTNTVFDLVHEESMEQRSSYTFQTVTVRSSIDREIIGSEFKEVSEYARGSVVFSNEWAKTAETLKIGTIIESPSGKKYKTTASAVVPGYTLSGVQKIVGVSKPVPVIAVESGTSSNNPGATFTVPSFSAKKRQLLFAKSVGPLAGGDSGVRHSLSPEEEKSTVELLRQQLTERLRRETRAQVPEEFFVSPDMQYIYINPDDFELEGQSIKYVAQAGGSITSYIIKREVLYKLIAEEVLREAAEGDFYVSNLSGLTFQISSSVSSNPSIIPDQIQVTVNGTGVLTSRIDAEGFHKDVAGRSVKEFREYVSGKTTIEKAELSLLPFWSPNLPSSDKMLRIIVR